MSIVKGKRFNNKTLDAIRNRDFTYCAIVYALALDNIIDNDTVERLTGHALKDKLQSNILPLPLPKNRPTRVNNKLIRNFLRTPLCEAVLIDLVMMNILDLKMFFMLIPRPAESFNHLRDPVREVLRVPHFSYTQYVRQVKADLDFETMFIILRLLNIVSTDAMLTDTIYRMGFNGLSLPGVPTTPPVPPPTTKTYPLLSIPIDTGLKGAIFKVNFTPDELTDVYVYDIENATARGVWSVKLKSGRSLVCLYYDNTFAITIPGATLVYNVIGGSPIITPVYVFPDDDSINLFTFDGQVTDPIIRKVLSSITVEVRI